MSAIRKRVSEVRAKLQNVVSNDRGGFFVQYDYGHLISREIAPYPAVEAVFDKVDHAAFTAEIASHADTFQAFGAAPADPVWDSAMFSPIDGMVAYSIVRRYQPKRIIEIGSGDSTRFLVKPATGSANITCIDPEPRRSISELPVNFDRRVIDNGDVALVEQLDANDILFIDSSHIMQPGMDVDIEFNRFFPALKPGVLVHVHDIFLPDGYPREWDRRNWNEQNALIGWIVSGYFEVIFANHYAVTRHPILFGGPLAALLASKHLGAGSIWLRRAGPRPN